MTVLLGIRQDNAVLKQDLIKTLDSKMSQLKYELDRDLGIINERVTQHSVDIDEIRKSSQADRVEFRELDVKVQSIEDEVDSLRMGTQTEVRSLVDQISYVETSLAQDMETVKGNIEEKFEETKRHQMLTEDRLNDVL